MRVQIERLDHFGRGICYIDSKITFVEDALVGEIVEIEVTKENKNYNTAKVISYIKQSDDRTDPICPYYNECGGCNIMHISYEKQLEFKKNKVKDILTKYGNVPSNKINNIIYDKQFGYRNKITLHSDGEKLGLYSKDSNDIIEIDECYLVNSNINEKIKRLKYLDRYNDNPYNEVIIRGTNDILVSIDGESDKENIKDDLLNKKFIISPKSFYQVNQYVVPLLYQKVIDEVKNKNYKNALDLYCGSGTIGILISDYVDEVVGVEVNESSYKDALKNKKINNCDNVSFINGKVEDYIDEFKNYDLVIVDPPRRGLDNHTIDVLLNISPKSIIYVSCDPMTLARDIKILQRSYNVENVTPVDMFPNTYHCESITVLERKN